MTQKTGTTFTWLIKVLYRSKLKPATQTYEVSIHYLHPKYIKSPYTT